MNKLYLILDSANKILSIAPPGYFEQIGRGSETLETGVRIVVVKASVSDSIKSKVLIGATATVVSNEITAITPVTLSIRQMAIPDLIRIQETFRIMHANVHADIWATDVFTNLATPIGATDGSARAILARVGGDSQQSSIDCRIWINSLARASEQIALREVGASWTDAKRIKALQQFYDLAGRHPDGRTFVKVWYDVMQSDARKRRRWFVFRQRAGSPVYVDHLEANGDPRGINGDFNIVLTGASFSANWNGERIAG